MLTFYFSGVDGQMTESEILTSGMVGKQVKLEFSPEWDGLQKTAVFTAGDVTRDMLWQGDAVKIPHEVLAQPLRRLRVSVYGVSEDGTLVIPTIRALGPEIQPGANPTDDPGTEPTLEVWAQMQMQLGDLALLDTDAKESLVAAVNELAQSKGDGANQEVVSATHEWDGTVLKITSASGTSSSDLKGPKGDTGATGATGAAGYTPVRGTDYWTEADKAEIVAAVIESLGGNPVFGYVDEHNNIIVSGSLADGTYSVKYEMEDGSTVDIGDLVLDSNVYYSVANNLTDCTSNNSATQAVQGGSYSATITANSGYELSSVKVTMGGTDISSTAVSGGNISIVEVTGDIVITAVATEVQSSGYTNLANPSDTYWKDGYRLSISSGGTSACEGRMVTNFIPAKGGDVLRTKGVYITDKLVNGQNCKIVMYSAKDSESSKLGGLYGIATNDKDSYGNTVSVAGDISTITLLTANDGTQLSILSSTQYIRLDCVLMDGYTAEDVIITINESIE